MKDILLIGNPNCGKTTLFNALTHDNQRVGNWPGVTVEKKSGLFFLEKEKVSLTDLPGIYSLTRFKKGGSIDEVIASDAITSLPCSLIINVIDACHLERHLYLTSQLLELGKPLIIALNMMDLATDRGISIDINVLSKQLKCPVIPLQAQKKIGLKTLLQAIQSTKSKALPLHLNLPESANTLLKTLQEELLTSHACSDDKASFHALRMMEGSDALATEKSQMLIKAASADNELDILAADARYTVIHQLLQSCQKKSSDASLNLTAKVDSIILHRYLSLPIFFTMMYLMFLFAIHIGGVFQDFFDIASDAIFVQGSAHLLQAMHASPWLIALISSGIGVGINTTLTFIPVIAAMFFFLSLLESSGYMARAAFVVDKIMRLLGLPGKSFVPMIVGFGCNVPAIMAARTLDSERDRLLTVLMSPFMSCSARLAIYTVFVAAFFPTGGQNVVFALYAIGIVMAVATGLLLRKTSLSGPASPLVLELPAYHKPSLIRLIKDTHFRLRYFIMRAGRMIIPVCVILGALNALTFDNHFSEKDASLTSLLSLIGQGLTPFFSPLGVQQDNWPATVGLLTGMLAKEVVVGSLNSLYTELGHLTEASAISFDFLTSMKAALWSIPDNIMHLKDVLINPLSASAADSRVSHGVYGMMLTRFDGQAGAFAYLLFILLYIPCVSTMAAIREEASRALMWFSIIWSFLLAYSLSVIFYQLARFSLHPLSSLAWVASMLFMLLAFIGFLHYRSVKKDKGGLKHVMLYS